MTKLLSRSGRFSSRFAGCTLEVKWRPGSLLAAVMFVAVLAPAALAI